MKPPASLYEAMGRILDALVPDDNEIIGDVMVQVFAGIYGHLPKEYWAEKPKQNGSLSIPLYDALDSCGHAITDGMLPILYDKKLVENGQLYEIRKQLFENE